MATDVGGAAPASRAAVGTTLATVGVAASPTTLSTRRFFCSSLSHAARASKMDPNVDHASFRMARNYHVWAWLSKLSAKLLLHRVPRVPRVHGVGPGRRKRKRGGAKAHCHDAVRAGGRAGTGALLDRGAHDGE